MHPTPGILRRRSTAPAGCAFRRRLPAWPPGAWQRRSRPPEPCTAPVARLTRCPPGCSKNPARGFYAPVRSFLSRSRAAPNLPAEVELDRRPRTPGRDRAAAPVASRVRWALRWAYRPAPRSREAHLSRVPGRSWTTTWPRVARRVLKLPLSVPRSSCSRRERRSPHARWGISTSRAKHLKPASQATQRVISVILGLEAPSGWVLSQAWCSILREHSNGRHDPE